MFIGLHSTQFSIKDKKETIGWLNRCDFKKFLFIEMAYELCGIPSKL